MVECNAEIDLGQYVRQQTAQRAHIALAIEQNLPPLLRREGPALHDALPHRVFLLGADGVESVVAQRAEQSFAFRCVAAVG